MTETNEGRSDGLNGNAPDTVHETGVFSTSGLRRYFRNTVWLFLGQGYQLIVGFFVTVSVARWLGPEYFGQLNYWLAMVMILGILANLGLVQIITRRLVDNPEERPQILGTAILLATCIGILIYAGVIAVMLRTANSPTDVALFIVMGAILCVSPFRFIEAWFQSQVRAGYVVAVTTIAISVSAILKIAFILQERNVVWFGSAYTIEAIVLACLLLLVYRMNAGSLRSWRFNAPLGKALLRESWPLLFSGLSIVIYLRMDQVMLRHFSGDLEVGVYSAATRLSTIWYLVPILLATSLFPEIVKLKNKSRRIYTLRLQQYFDLSSLLAYLAFIPVFLLGPWLVSWIFGEAYSGGGAVLRVHVLSVLVVYIGVARTQIMISEGFTKILLLSNLAGALVNLAGNFLLIPLFGGIGAAWATCLGLVAAAIVCSSLYPNIGWITELQLRAFGILFRLPKFISGMRTGEKLAP